MKQSQKQKTLAGKLAFRLFVAFLLIFSCMISFITLSTRNDLEKREMEKLELLALENANIAKAFMDSAYERQKVVSTFVQTLDRIDPAQRVDVLTELMTRVGENQKDALSFFYVAEPNQLIPNTPEGISIFVTANGAEMQHNRFEFVDENVYMNAISTKTNSIIDPFKKTIDGKEYMVITIFMPILNEKQEVLGVVGSNIDTAMLSAAPYMDGGFETFNNQIICGHKTIIIYPSFPQSIGQPFLSASSSKNPQRALDILDSGKSGSYLDEFKDGQHYYRALVPFTVGDFSMQWLSGTAVSQGEFNQQIISQVVEMALIASVCLILILLFSYGAIRRMLNPLKEIEYATRQMAQGNLHARISHRSNDEIGRLAVSFNESLEEISSYVDEIDWAMEEMAQGNFDISPKKEFVGDFQGIQKSIINFIRRICSTLQQISDSAAYVSEGSNQLSNASSSLSNGAAEQAASIEELTQTIQALTQKVHNNDVNATEAGDCVGKAGQQLQVSVHHMRDMTTAMDDITKNSSEIGKIIKTIEDIAFQTNILALNAAVEAARAGAAGKGFAVVADEVRNLASKSAQAAKNTTVMIENSIHAVENGSQIAREAADSLLVVEELAKNVVTIVDEICTSSKMQLSQVRDVSSNAEQISQVIQTNSATSEESAASSEELAAQAKVLRELVRRFTLNQKLMEDTPNTMNHQKALL